MQFNRTFCQLNRKKTNKNYKKENERQYHDYN